MRREGEGKSYLSGATIRQRGRPLEVKGGVGIETGHTEPLYIRCTILTRQNKHRYALGVGEETPIECTKTEDRWLRRCIVLKNQRWPVDLQQLDEIVSLELGQTVRRSPRMLGPRRQGKSEFSINSSSLIEIVDRDNDVVDLPTF